MQSKTILSELLNSASNAHHEHFERTTGGEDRDWSIWYSNWLLGQPDFLALFDDSSDFYNAKLIYTLLALDIDYTASSKDQSWSDYYAEHFLDYINKMTSN